MTLTELNPGLATHETTPVRRTVVKSWRTRRQGRTLQLRAVQQVEVLPSPLEGTEPGLLISERYYRDQQLVSKSEFKQLAGRRAEEIFR